MAIPCFWVVSIACRLLRSFQDSQLCPYACWLLSISQVSQHTGPVLWVASFAFCLLFDSQDSQFCPLLVGFCSLRKTLNALSLSVGWWRVWTVQVLIFSQMTRLLDILDYFLEERGHKAARIDGSVKLADRRSQVRRNGNKLACTPKPCARSRSRCCLGS